MQSYALSCFRSMFLTFNYTNDIILCLDWQIWNRIFILYVYIELYLIALLTRNIFLLTSLSLQS